MYDLLGASVIFDYIFTDTSTFRDLPAVNGIRSLVLGLSYALFILGLARLLTSSPTEAGGRIFTFVVALLALTLFPKLATSIYDVSSTVQDNTGINPGNLTDSMSRLAADSADGAYSTGGRGMTDVAGKIGDTLSNIIVDLTVSVVRGFAYVVYFLLQLGYLLRDLAFAAALLLVPLALGFVVSPFGKEKGITLLFGALGIALWPLGWLFVDALVQLMLVPLDSALSNPSGTRNGLGKAIPAASGIIYIVILGLYFFKIIIIIGVGYLQSALFIQRIMGAASGMALRWSGGGGGGGGGRDSAKIANILTGGVGGVARVAGGSRGGRTGNGTGGTGGNPRFGGRRAAPAVSPVKPYRGRRPSFS